MAITDKVATERRNLGPAALYEHAIRRDEAAIVSTGALTAETGKHTGRSPKDKSFVKEPTSQDAIWWHPGNQPIGSDRFDALLRRMQEFIDAHEVYTQDVFACADPRYRLRVRVVSEMAWHSLFARNLFIRPTADELMGFEPDFTVISLPSFKADPARDGTHSETFILVNVVFDPRTRVPDYDSDEKTENTRAAYPVDLIPNAILTGVGSHPHNVMFLSADAYGVLPPVARLDEDQIRHYFLAGYTAKVAGTERGVTEPEPIFSTCFAAPFLVLPPERYADMLIERMTRKHVDVWLQQ